MLNGKFSYITKDNTEDFSIGLTLDNKENIRKKRKVVALAINNKKTFIESYFKVLDQENIPLILNPQIPLKKLQELSAQLKANELILDLDIKTNYKLPQLEIDSNAGHILCSSGTTSKTGSQKTFFFSFPKPIKNAIAHCDSLNIKKDKKVLFPLPITHSFGIIVGTYASIVRESHTYLYENTPGALTILSDLKKYHIDILYLTPSLARQMIKYAKRFKETIHCPEIISIGSSVLFKTELDDLKKVFPGSTFFYTYGLTEMGPRVASFDSSDLHSLTTNTSINLPLGKPIPGVSIRVNDDTGNELEVFSPYACDGFEHEYFGTNDRVEIETGEIYIQGRMDETIIHQGINIYPLEIEALLMQRDDIHDCALIGVPSKTYGEIPVLVLNNNTDEKEIFEFLAENLPSGHIPKKIIMGVDIPKTNLGKIQRNKIKESIGEIF